MTDDSTYNSDTGLYDSGIDAYDAGYTPLPTGKLWIGRFIGQDPTYTLQNEVISYAHTESGKLRPNMVAVDGLDDSWTEYDRGDLISRDVPVVSYLDLPELENVGDVRQRAVEELEEARRATSPGGTVVWNPEYTRLDNIYWIDQHNSKYATRIEGLAVEFNQSTEPYQHANVDNGVMIYCPPDEADAYLVRDLFEREDATGLGTADTGGDWTVYYG